MNYVIIGNSVAAVGAIRGIRSIDPQGNITVISRERHVAYGRPLISYLLGGLITEKRMAYLPEDFYEKNRVNLLLNAEVVGVDTGRQKVTITGGDVIAYDKLLVATGGDPFVPPIEGLAGKDRIFTFTTWDDAAKLKGIADDIEKVVVIGGGLIGLKAAEGLHLLDKKITIVELADRILSAAFDRPAGRVVAKKMKANGIDVITEDTVVRIEGDGAAITGVTLKSGDFIPCDTVIVAIGVRPAAGFLKGSGVEVNRGIVVDDMMETNVKGVFAAGDVAEAKDFFSGVKNPMPIWPDAYVQGDIAGVTMAGGSKGYPGGIAMNSIELFKVSTISMGITNPVEPKEYEILTYQDLENYQYRKIVLKDGLLAGAVLVGAVDRAGIFAGLIRDRVEVSSFKDQLLTPDFGFVNLPREIRSALFAPVGKVTGADEQARAVGH
ncbi:FAD-dependent oxidoreductase [Geobacter hydrogenophilus]|uniref:Pyridine nucleotide-disulfide oxidoreductase n=1 Tax=Geobacter hydrogenophilus TaxID=40983 RepID=A0A9W6G1F1_9BACT|nr:FAD-dependent oxidoreductase [Geobacter hydrogenophilus]MBT0893080.1 FAD-dependent oxidoreductase [Geobacter hydrogenophilus]GLI39080.1 pyridine nucleotide-disulfide oxidoreductase [Geobacter hydrogenophilus]